MEALILIHSTQRIFWQNDLPSTPLQYSQAYERATGASEMIEQQKAQTLAVMAPGKVGSRGISQVSVVSQMYWNRFCFGHKQPVSTLPDVENILNIISQNELEGSLSGLRILGTTTPQPLAIVARDAYEHTSNRALTDQFQKTHMLTNIQLLDVLCSRVSQESYALNFDYFSFHTRCTLVLDTVAKEFEKEIEEMGGEKLDWRSGELPVAPHWLFKMMQDAKKKDDVLDRITGAIEKVIQEVGSREIFAVREFLRHKGDDPDVKRIRDTPNTGDTEESDDSEDNMSDDID